MDRKGLELLRKIEYPSLGERPAEILESSLYRDTENFQVILYLKMKNVSGKEIEAVYVDICCFDENVCLLSSKTAEGYENLNATDGEIFGDSMAVALPSLRTASITATLNCVRFSDSTSWKRDEADLPEQNTEEIPVSEINRRLLESQDNKGKKRNRTEKNPWSKELSEEEKQRRRRGLRISIIGTAVLAAVIFGAMFGICRRVSVNNQMLDSAVELFEKGQYKEASEELDKLLRNKFAGSIKQKIWWYKALVSIHTEDYAAAVSDLSALGGWGESAFYLRQLNGLLSGVTGAGERHSVALKKDGTVVSAGSNEYGQCSITEWTDVIAVAAGVNHTLGLKSNGTVAAAGDDTYSQCETGRWESVIAIAAGQGHSVGVLNTGRVIAAGDNTYGQCNVENWSGIIAVAAGYNHTVGLRQDGTVVAAGDNSLGACDVENWQDIVSISAGGGFTVGVCQDGTVVAVGDNSYYQCDINSLADISSVAAGDFHLLALSGGRLKTTGDNQWHQADTSLWKQLISVSGGLHHSIGVSADGTAYSTGDNKSGQCDVDGWTDLGLPRKAMDITSLK